MTEPDLLQPAELVAALKALGFRTRTANALAYSGAITVPEDLRSWKFGDPQDRTHLHVTLTLIPNLGLSGLSEVLAYRHDGDPRKAAETRDATVTTRPSPALKAELDAWAKASGMTQAQALAAAVEAIVREPPPARFQTQVRP